MKAILERKIFKNEIDGDSLFRQGVRLCLAEDRDVDAILQNFIQAFVNLNDLESIGYGKLKYFSNEYSNIKIEGPVGAVSVGSDVFFKSNLFANYNLFTSIIFLFHELEHCKTYYKNKNNSALRNEEVLGYSSEKPYTPFCMYITSDNEHNSRLAEIVYLEKFVQTLETIINTEPEFKTDKNEKVLKKLKRRLKEHAIKVDKQYEKNLKKRNSQKNANKIKTLAKEAFELFKSDEQLKEEDEDRIFSYIMDYLYAFKDESFAEEVLEYIRKSRHPYMWKSVHDIFNSGAIKASNENIDKLIFKYSYLGGTFLKLINGEDLAKHNLLFHGKAIIDSATGKQIEEMKEFRKSVSKYKFNGIAIKFEDDKYSFEINGEVLEFDNALDGLIALSDYINISIFDNLTTENINQLNDMLGYSLIEPLEAKAEKKEAIENEELSVEKESEVAKAEHELSYS